MDAQLLEFICLAISGRGRGTGHIIRQHCIVIITRDIIICVEEKTCMSPGKISTRSIIIRSVLTILCSAAFTIAIHAIMPASVDVEQLDSVLVTFFGFPSIAVSYFLILYTQCTVAVRYICNRTKVSNLQMGIRFGLSFALIYLFGMQEVAEVSPSQR
mgnify:CR=1 FL=1